MSLGTLTSSFSEPARPVRLHPSRWDLLLAKVGRRTGLVQIVVAPSPGVSIALLFSSDEEPRSLAP